MAARVSLAELSSAGFALHSAEAAAIVVEVCRQYVRGDLRGIPSAHVIRLTPDGRVVAEGPITTSQPPIARAAQLLQDLLPPLDAPAAVRVPGGLRLVIARALRTIDVPPFASLDEFCAALRRFAAEDLGAAARSLYGSWQGTHEARELTISDLRRARRATGLSLDCISSVSGVSVPLLRELEWGYMKNWRRDAEGRSQLGRYARAAGLDEQLVLSIAWPMIEEAARDAALAPAPTPEVRTSQPEIVEGIVLAQNILPIPATPPGAERRRFSLWALVSAAAILLVAGLTLTFWHPRAALEAARRPEFVDTAPPLADIPPAPVSAPAPRLTDEPSTPREPVVRAVQPKPSKAKAGKPAVKRTAAPKKPASKPNFFKRTLLRIVLR